MGVTVTEIWPGRGAKVESYTQDINSLTLDPTTAGGKESSTRVFRVAYDAVGDGDEYTALTADDGTTAVPSIGAGHPTASKLKVSGKSSKQLSKDARLFDVTVSYKTDESEGSGGGSGGETDTGLPTIGGRSIQRTVAAESDVNGKPIVNSAGDPFDPPPEIETTTQAIYVRGTIDFDVSVPLTLKTYRDTINVQGLFGFPAFGCKLSETTWNTRRVSQTEVGIDIELVWYIDDWSLTLVDNGIFQVEDGEGAIFENNTGDGAQSGTVALSTVVTTNRQRVLDKDGVPVDKPVLLDGNGQPLGNGAPVNVGPFQMYFTANHDNMLQALGLPTNLADYATIPN